MRSEEQRESDRKRAEQLRAAARANRLNRPPESAGSRLLREATGRGVMLVIGLALVYAGYRCFLVAWDLYHDPLTGDDYQSPTVKLPAMIGVILIPLGGLLALFAVIPIKAMARFNRPMTMGDNEVE